MPKGKRSNTRRGAYRDQPQESYQNHNIRRVTIAPPKESFEPINAAQRAYTAAIKSHTLAFGLGPAGTGKTHVAVAIASEMLLAGEIDQIIVTRPAVEAGESLGFLPGELEDKFDPFLAPVREILNKSLGKSSVDSYIKNERIKALPLAYMRGHTFERAFIIADEMQNSSSTQMQLLLTRVGQYSKIVVNGDLAQKDISGMSGLEHATRIVGDMPGVTVYSFQIEDIIRSNFAQKVAARYNNCISSKEESEKQYAFDDHTPTFFKT